MPRRIDAETDMKILADAGLGARYKDIAAKHKVSPSYVSKLCTGKKSPDIILTKQSDTPKDFASFDPSIDAISAFIGTKDVFVTKEAAIAFLKVQLAGTIKLAKVYYLLLTTLTKEN